MKVRIGGVQRSVASQGDLNQIERELAGRIRAQARDKGVTLARPMLRRLGQVVQLAAMQEAGQMMDMVAEATSRPQPFSNKGLTAAFLMRGMDLTPGGRRVLQSTGMVPWDPLTRRYELARDKKFPRSRGRMFHRRGALTRYLKRSGPSIVSTRLGGMKVDVNTSIPQTALERDVLPEDVPKVLLGRVTLTMFPRISPTMAPMLATRRWTDGGTGEMEKAVFSGTRTAQKLLNRRNAYRPLLTPVVQFFILNRIPAAVNRKVSEYVVRITTSRGEI